VEENRETHASKLMHSCKQEKRKETPTFPHCRTIIWL